jgi:hypothetical protein
MLIKKDEVSLNLLKLFGRETIDSIKKNIIVQLNIQVEEIPNEIEYSMRVMVKVSYYLLSFFIINFVN